MRKSDSVQRGERPLPTQLIKAGAKDSYRGPPESYFLPSAMLEVGAGAATGPGHRNSSDSVNSGNTMVFACINAHNLQMQLCSVGVGVFCNPAVQMRKPMTERLCLPVRPEFNSQLFGS